MAIKEKDKVHVEYEGRFENGEVFDSTAMHGGELLEFIPGTGMLVSGFEKAVIGMNEGEEKEVTLKPEEAYGESNPEYVQKLPKDKFPAEAKEGMQIGIPTPMGQIPATITKIGEDFVEIDMNHPMAGKTLIFKIKVVKAEDGPFEVPTHHHHHHDHEEGHSCSCGDDGCSDDEDGCAGCSAC